MLKKRDIRYLQECIDSFVLPIFLQYTKNTLYS